MMFGMDFEQVKGLISTKPNFEEKRGNDEAYLMYTTMINNKKMDAIIYFENKKIDNFRVRVDTYVAGSEQRCKKDYLSIYESVRGKYGKPVIEPAKTGFAGLYFFSAYFSFSNNRHIEVMGSYESSRSRCFQNVMYKNVPIDQKTIAEFTGKKHASQDTF